jgi:hypothetical protein
VKLLATLTLALSVSAGLTVYGAWCVKVFAGSDLAPTADLTTKLVWRSGQALIWVATGFLAAGVAGTAAVVVARALGG